MPVTANCVVFSDSFRTCENVLFFLFKHNDLPPPQIGLGKMLAFELSGVLYIKADTTFYLDYSWEQVIPLEFLSFQPLHSDFKGFLSGENGLVAEIPCRFIVDEGMVYADTID